VSDGTKIEWTDASWNCVTGCTKVSAGCDHCYAETFAERWRGTPGHHFENGFDVTLRPERLDQPLHWKRPRRIFVNSMSDVFHEAVPDEFIACMFAVMAKTPQHTYQLLTKRHGRMRSLLSSPEFQVLCFAAAASRGWDLEGTSWPLPNVWLGVSVEDQKWADIRIPALLDTPAHVRFLSCEPLLGPVNLWHWIDPSDPNVDCDICGEERFADEIGQGHEQIELYFGEKDPGNRPGGEWCPGPGADAIPRRIDWVIAGGESGPGARPMVPAWVRSLRDQCQGAGVPFFFKQWGSHRWVAHSVYDDATQCWVERGIEPQRVSKKLAGRELDGRTWDEFPVAAEAVPV
jgi:protein gp37